MRNRGRKAVITHTSSVRNEKPRLEPIRFGEFLCEKNLITVEQLLDALADHWLNGGRIGDAVERLGLLPREQIEVHARDYHGLDVIEVVA